MLKLYRFTDGIIDYWETWEQDENTAIVHWGIVGDKGQSDEVRSSLFSPFHKKIQKLITEKIEEGYGEIDEDELVTLLIEYEIDGFGTTEDLDKRHRLEERMNETLGWTGLGHCDGGSIGSGTMEVCCYVVDFETAKKVITDDLRRTEFENFKRIFDENAD